MILSKREAVFRRDGRTCVYCQRDEEDLPPGKSLTLDHLDARVNGGTNDPENLVTSCALCNRRKGRMPLEKFVGPKRAAEIRELARRPLDKPMVPGRVLNPPPRYPTSMNNKLHDLVRDLVALVEDDRIRANVRGRARTLGVKFPGLESK